MDTAISIVVKTAMEPPSAAKAVRAAVWSVDAEVPVSRIRTMSEVVTGTVAQRRFPMRLAVGFALSALLLASIGMFGVVSYAVARRSSEIAIPYGFGRPVVRRIRE